MFSDCLFCQRSSLNRLMLLIQRAASAEEKSRRVKTWATPQRSRCFQMRVVDLRRRRRVLRTTPPRSAGNRFVHPFELGSCPWNERCVPGRDVWDSRALLTLQEGQRSTEALQAISGSQQQTLNGSAVLPSHRRNIS